MQTRQIIEAAINSDSTAIPEQKKRGVLTSIRFSARRVRLDETEVLDFARNGIKAVV